MNYATAKKVADEIVSRLAPFCDRIEIAGSVRREKQDDIHDVEVVAISRKAVAVFGASPVTPLETTVAILRGEGTMIPRPDKLGRNAWGAKFKRAVWNGTPFDLFIVTPETWGCQFLIRTGNADFSHKVVTPINIGGLLPPLFNFKDGRLQKAGESIDTPEEIDVFNAIGLDYIEPKRRTWPLAVVR